MHKVCRLNARPTKDTHLSPYTCQAIPSVLLIFFQTSEKGGGTLLALEEKLKECTESHCHIQRHVKESNTNWASMLLKKLQRVAVSLEPS